MLLFLSIWSVSVGALASAPDHNLPTRKEEERKALDERWSSLIEQRNQPDAAKWNDLEQDLRSFASRYDIHLEEHAKKAPPVRANATSDFAQCPPHDDVRGYRCILFMGPKGVCRYMCLPLSPKPESEKRGTQ